MTNRKLSTFLTDHRTTNKDEYYTHVSCIRPKGRFVLERETMEEFWNIYLSELYNDPEMVCGLAEIPREYSMLVVDVDIKVKITSGDVPYRIYSINHVKELIKVYQEEISEITIDLTDEYFTCVLLEKDPYIDKEYLKSGFHLAFINYFPSKAASDIYLLPLIKEKVNSREIFKDLGYNKSSDVLDIGKVHTRSKPWLLYGSRKKEESKPYIISKIFDSNLNELPLDFSNYKIYDYNQRELSLTKDYDYYYPRIFSTDPWGRKTVELKSRYTEIVERSLFAEPKRDFNEDEDQEDIKIQDVRKLLSLLSPERSAERDSWMEIGWILYSIGDGNQDFLDLWIEFSMQCLEKFNEQVCLNEWTRMYKGTYTLASLKYFASIDSPEEYKELQDVKIYTYLKNAISGTHTGFAKALYETYGSTFVCASIKPKMWFTYDNHRWRLTEEGIELRSKISTDLVIRYGKIVIQYQEELNNADDEDIGAYAAIQARLKSSQKIRASLKAAPFKNNIMKECEEIFYKAEFLEKLDKNKYLIGFKNGVYDLKEHVFRCGIPEDYLSLQLPHNFKEFNELDPWIIETNSYFEKVFPDVSVREYFLNTMAEVFVGGNMRKNVYVWTGTRNNAKSKTKRLFQLLFGPYMIDLPTTVLLGRKTRAGAPCPELARAQGVRLIVAQEPDKREEFNVGTLKELSGNDTFFARSLFEKGGEIFPMFKMVLICNDLPKLPCDDPAVWIRIKVVPFESVFIDNAPQDEEEQLLTKTFPKDNNIDEKLPNMVEPLIWILLQRLKLIKDIISEPEKVLQHTERYRKMNDVFAQFIDERLVKDEKAALHLLEFYAEFRDWHKVSFPGFTIPIKYECNEYLTEHWGSHSSFGKWKGYRIRTEQDDLQDGRAQLIKEEEDWDLPLMKMNSI